MREVIALSSIHRFLSQQLKQLKSDLAVLTTALKKKVTIIQQFSDTISGVKINNEITLTHNQYCDSWRFVLPK